MTCGTGTWSRYQTSTLEPCPVPSLQSGLSPAAFAVITEEVVSSHCQQHLALHAAFAVGHLQLIEEALSSRGQSRTSSKHASLFACIADVIGPEGPIFQRPAAASALAGTASVAGPQQAVAHYGTGRYCSWRFK